MPDEDANDLNLPPFNWERLLRWLLVVGLILWIVAGALSTWFYYFTSDIGGGFVTLTKTLATLEGIAFKVWIASAVLLLFLWLWARRAPAQPPPSN